MSVCSEDAMKIARKMLALGFVAGVSLPNDLCQQPTDERVAELARLIDSGAVDPVAAMAGVK